MNLKQPNRPNWAQRLDDWEQSTPTRPGEGPGRAFWEQLSAELAPPPRRRRPPFWLWSALGVLLLTHFIGYHPNLGAFPLPGNPAAIERAATDHAAEAEPVAGPTTPATGATEKNDDRGPERPVSAGTVVAEPPPVATPTPSEAADEAPAPAAADRTVATEQPATPTGRDHREQLAVKRPERTPGTQPGADPIPAAGPVESGQLVEAPIHERSAKPTLISNTTPAVLETSKTTFRADTTFRIRYSARAKIPVPLPQYPVATVADPSSFAAPGGQLRVSVGVHYAPVSNRTRLTIDPGVLTARRTRESRVPEWGLNLYLGLGPHWGLRTGLTTTRLQTESQYRFIRFFNPQREDPDPAGDGLSKYDVEVASPYAKSSAEVELLRPRDQLLQNGARLRMDLRLRETVALRSVPLQITYANAWGRFGLEAQLGPEWNHSEVLDFAATATVQVAGLRTGRVRIQSREQISRGSYWSLAGGLAATYRIGRRWQVGLIPEFTTSLENLSARPDFSASSRSAGVRLETRYRLGGK